VSADYNVTQPTDASQPWNVALVLDPSAPEASLTFVRVGPVPDVPYSSTQASGIIRATGRVVNAWGLAADGSASPTLIPCELWPAWRLRARDTRTTLVPFGTTHLRITEVPYVLP